MTKIIASRVPLLSTVGLAALAVCAAPANALSSRTYVSGKGTDTGICAAVGAPCASFQFAHDQTAPGGEIIVLDSGSYGPVRVNKSISILNDGAGTASVLAKVGASVFISSLGPADAVLLRGLNIVGSNNGISATDVGSLTIENCVIQGVSTGISVSPATGPARFSISHTIIDGSSNGISFHTGGGGSAEGVIDHVLANKNKISGISLSGVNTKAAIVDSVLSNNGSTTFHSGLLVESGASATVRNVTASHNFGAGFASRTSSTLRIAHSVAIGNKFGISNSGATAESYGDNDLGGNTSGPVSGSLTSVGNQ